MRVSETSRVLEPRRLREFLNAGTGPLPVLVLRVPDLERIAWRRGLREARAIERRTTRAFEDAAARLLRSGDLIAHEGGSDVYVAVLLEPTRTDGTPPAPMDARSTLARIATAMQTATRLDVITGWTTGDPGPPDGLDALVKAALVQGAQERERYAFFSTLGHELRTPLAAIRGYLETLLDEIVPTETRRRFTRIAYNETLRLGRLVDGMFELSLLDLETARPSRAKAVIGDALVAAGDACRASAAARAVALDFGEAPDICAAFDGDRLALVLINLIDNAVKHGRKGGRVAVSVARAAGCSVVLHVDDDGDGVPAADHERIFAFGARGVTAAAGRGIGLALVRLMLERSGGRVDAGRSPLGGARFSITIPAVAEG